MNVIKTMKLCDTYFIYDEDKFKITSAQKIGDKVTSFILENTNYQIPRIMKNKENL